MPPFKSQSMSQVLPLYGDVAKWLHQSFKLPGEPLDYVVHTKRGDTWSAPLRSASFKYPEYICLVSLVDDSLSYNFKTEYVDAADRRCSLQ